MATPRVRVAFTLIEMLLSMAIGLVICGTVFFAFRVASSTIRKANELALENRLMRAGISRAFDEADFWTLWDDPFDATAQPLRTGVVLLQGNGNPLANEAPATAPFRANLSFDPDFFDQSNPKVWWRSHPSRVSDKSFGNYACLATARDSDPDKRWFARSLVTINQAIGHYGLLDYLPANTVFGFANDYTRNAHYNDDEGEFTDTNRIKYDCYNTAPSFAMPTGNSADYIAPGDIASSTRNIAFVITTRDLVATCPLIGDGAADARNVYMSKHIDRFGFCAPYSDLSAGVPDFPMFIATDRNIFGRCGIDAPILASGPSDWPMTTLQITRYVKMAKWQTMAAVTMRSPSTGMTTMIQFPYTFTTTLRGARQQRGLDRYISGYGAAP